MNALADAQPHACATAVTGVFRSSMIRAWCRRSWVATGKGHAEVAAEQPPQGAFAGAYLLTHIRQRPGVRGIDLEHVRDGGQQGLGGCGQVVRLLGTGPELVEEHGEQSRPLWSVLLGIARVSQDQLSQQRA
jgi:hypothetical protein